MPRLMGKYDRSAYRRYYPRGFLMDRNFNMPLEEIARRHPEFANKWTEISRQAKLKEYSANTPQEREQLAREADRLIWAEVLGILRRERH